MRVKLRRQLHISAVDNPGGQLRVRGLAGPAVNHLHGCHALSCGSSHGRPRRRRQRRRPGHGRDCPYLLRARLSGCLHVPICVVGLHAAAGSIWSSRSDCRDVDSGGPSTFGDRLRLSGGLKGRVMAESRPGNPSSQGGEHGSGLRLVAAGRGPRSTWRLYDGYLDDGRVEDSLVTRLVDSDEGSSAGSVATILSGAEVVDVSHSRSLTHGEQHLTVRCVPTVDRVELELADGRRMSVATVASTVVNQRWAVFALEMRDEPVTVDCYDHEGRQLSRQDVARSWQEQPTRS